MQNIQNSDLIKININLLTTITNRYKRVLWNAFLHDVEWANAPDEFCKGKKKTIRVNTIWGGEGVFNTTPYRKSAKTPKKASKHPQISWLFLFL